MVMQVSSGDVGGTFSIHVCGTGVVLFSHDLCSIKADFPPSSLNFCLGEPVRALTLARLTNHIASVLEFSCLLGEQPAIPSRV